MGDDIGMRGNKAPHTLYVLDEPMVGLHMADVERLIPGAASAGGWRALVVVIDDHGGRLTIRLLQPFAGADHTIDRLRDIRRASRDAHVLHSQVAERLGFMPVEVEQEAFFSTWAEAYPHERDALLAQMAAFLPVEAPVQ